MRKATLPYTLLFICTCALACLAACQKPFADDSGSAKGKGRYTVTFGAFCIEQTPFGQNTGGKSRTATASPKDVCTRMSIAIFDESNERVATDSKESSQADFGQFAIKLDEGKYRVVVVAHSGTGNATMTSPTEIKFKDNKLTDTFYAYRDIDISSDDSYSLTLKRAVAMFRLVVNDPTPDDVGTMKFYYTGGSSTLDATTGCGNVNSKQTELRTVEAAAHTGASTYDVYTFPHADGKRLKMTVSALKKNDSQTVLYTKTFDDVQVVRNVITQYSGNFYDKGSSSERSFSIDIDSQWDNAHENRYEY